LDRSQFDVTAPVAEPLTLSGITSSRCTVRVAEIEGLRPDWRPTYRSVGPLAGDSPSWVLEPGAETTLEIPMEQTVETTFALVASDPALPEDTSFELEVHEGERTVAVGSARIGLERKVRLAWSAKIRAYASVGERSWALMGTLEPGTELVELQVEPAGQASVRVLMYGEPLANIRLGYSFPNWEIGMWDSAKTDADGILVIPGIPACGEAMLHHHDMVFEIEVLRTSMGVSVVLER
jgi:hypothetical protein